MLIFIAVFVVMFLVVALCVGFGQAFLVSRQKNQVRRMLRQADAQPGVRHLDLLKPAAVPDALSRAIGGLAASLRISSLLEQSGLGWSSGKFLILSVIAALIGFGLGSIVPLLSKMPLVAFAIAAVTSLAPFLYMMRKRSKRLAKFEEQFPEALNFLSRSMRAGHAFTIGLEMLVGDASEPLAFFFRQMLNDLHLGSDLEVAMGKLALAVPIIDVRFFVSAVLLQQGTGGNLSEILDTMAKIIRERFRLKGQIKAASAHGRVTGLILSTMPVVVAVLLFFISPEYLLVLARDPDGKKMVIGAIVAQFVGFLCIRKIVNIKV
jgi:tight adherence protein B